MRSRLRAILTKPSFLFLLSLAIATALWFFVRDATR